MDIDLPEDNATGIKKAMRCVRRNDDDAAGVNLARLITNDDSGRAFQRECYLDVRMRV